MLVGIRVIAPNPLEIKMHHLKCPTCKKITPVSDESGGEAAICEDCGSTLILLKAVQSAAGKTKDDPDTSPRSDSKKNSRIDKEFVDSDEDEEPKPKRKSKKKRSSVTPESDSEDEEERPKKRKVRTEGSDIVGRQLDVFTTGNDKIRIAAVLFCILAAVGLLSCVLSAMVKMPGATIAFAGVGLVGGLGGLLWCMNFLTYKVAVHAGGIVHSHGSKTQIIPWENIKSVTELSSESDRAGDLKGASHGYSLELTDLSHIVFTNKLVKDVEKLGHMIIENTTIVILPQVRLIYDTGEMVRFGKLGVNKSGFHYGKQDLVWQDIKGVKVSEGFITVNKDGKWQRWGKIAATSVPNLNVFLTFVNEILSAEAW